VRSADLANDQNVERTTQGTRHCSADRDATARQREDDRVAKPSLTVHLFQARRKSLSCFVPVFEDHTPQAATIEQVSWLTRCSKIAYGDVRPVRSVRENQPCFD